MGVIKGLYVKPNELPIEIEFENNLESKQKLVEGYIEEATSDLYPDVVFICNEEGKINGMPLNRDIGHDIIAGSFLILGDDYENSDYKSLTDEQINKYKKIFDEKSIEETNLKITMLVLKDQGFEL